MTLIDELRGIAAMKDAEIRTRENAPGEIRAICGRAAALLKLLTDPPEPEVEAPAPTVEDRALADAIRTNQAKPLLTRKEATK